MQRHIFKYLTLTALLAATACSNSMATMDREAGHVREAGDFGNATMNNTLVMTGEKSYALDLSRRFSTEVMTTINFAFNSADLDAGARDVLSEQAAWIRKFPEVRFRVYGHADAVGSNSYNKSISQRRANAVVNYFASQGISRSRLEAVVAYGETQPLIVTEGRERRNRRTVTEVTGFVKSHPNVMDGRYAQIIYRDYVASAAPVTTLTGMASAITGGSE